MKLSLKSNPGSPLIFPNTKQNKCFLNINFNEVRDDLIKSLDPHNPRTTISGVGIIASQKVTRIHGFSLNNNTLAFVR